MSNTSPTALTAEQLYHANADAYRLLSDEPQHRAHDSASINADDTAAENGFDYFSAAWFECYAASFQFCIDMGEKF